MWSKAGASAWNIGARFATAFVIGVGTMLFALDAFGGSNGTEALILLVLTLALAGALAALVRGVAAFAGVWLGVGAPWVFLWLTTLGRCTTVMPFPGCGEAVYPAFTVVFLVGGFVPEGAGFLAGKVVRWALFDPA